MTEREHCTGCGVCAAVCEARAIHMEPDPEGFLYPVVQRDRCRGCGRCDRFCPLSAGEPDRTAGWERLFFGAKAEEEEARLLGSSGGMFPLLARRVLQKGGAVFGSSLLPGGAVRHAGIESPGEIPGLAGTKYVQSDLSPAFGEMARVLREGRPLLFCGTPCQAAAVRSLFGAEGKGLLTVDLICYGVASPVIWQRYVRLLERRYRGTLSAFSFRDKRSGDDGRSCSFRIGGREYAGPLLRDPFCRSYFRNVNIRPSCFSCRYSTTRRQSDLTLGDFWGIEEVSPGFSDGMGCSAVICHTPAGKALWEEVRDRTQWFPCREEELANPRQPRLRGPVVPSPRRERYLRLYRRLPFPLWIRLFR